MTFSVILIIITPGEQLIQLAALAEGSEPREPSEMSETSKGSNRRRATSDNKYTFESSRCVCVKS